MSSTPLKREQRRDRLFDARYSVLFASIMLLVVLLPILAPLQTVVTPVFLLLLMIGVLATIQVEQRLFRRALVVGVIAFVLQLVATVLHDREGFPARSLDVIVLSLYTVFLAIALRALIHRIFQEKEITFETVKGGVAIYFLMGILWSFFYEIVLLFDPGALKGAISHQPFTDIFYFSFVTLTTLGYGDITPVSKTARMLVIFESTLGPLYLAIFVARLVSLVSGGGPKNGPKNPS